MRVSIALEERFAGTPDGAVWTLMPVRYCFWRRYLDVFDAVQVVARVRMASEPPEGAARADGPGVDFARLPYYVGPWQYLRRSRSVQRAVHTAIRREDAAILQVGSNVGNWVAGRLHQMHHPYGVEVVQDPYDAYAPGACDDPLQPFFRWLLTRRLKQQCRTACAAAYVTRAALQRRYPPAPGAFSTAFPNLDLPGEAFAATPRIPQPDQRTLTLISVGMMHQMYKAQDVLIDALARCVEAGMDLRLVLVGDGRYRPALEARVARYGLEARVVFAGALASGTPVWQELDRADLFVLPSRQEGLPRAMIEAMARGLPCIGSTVGGFPELLDAQDLVPPDDLEALVQAISTAVTTPGRLAAMAEHCLARAADYHADRVQERRIALCWHVREATERWLVQAQRNGA